MHLFPVALMLTACAPEAETAAAPDERVDTGALLAEYCGSTAPTMGPVFGDIFYDESGPRLTIMVFPYDADGGIHDVTLEVWADPWVDGDVSLVAGPRWAERLVHGQATCGPSGGHPYLWDLRLEEQGFREGGVEMAMRLVDADGNPSSFAYIDFCLRGSDEGCGD